MGSGAVGIAKVIKDYGKEWKFQSGEIGLLALGLSQGSEGVWCSWLALVRTMLDFSVLWPDHTHTECSRS